MSLISPERKAAKAEVIKTNATKANDTGSPEVQIAILTERDADGLEVLRHSSTSRRTRRITTPVAAF